jgi:hypothetical protein
MVLSFHFRRFPTVSFAGFDKPSLCLLARLDGMASCWNNLPLDLEILHSFRGETKKPANAQKRNRNDSETTEYET